MTDPKKPAAPVVDEKMFATNGDNRPFPNYEVMPDPSDEMLASPQFEAVWNVIKSWDVNVPEAYSGYCSANGSHVAMILNALVASPPAPAGTPSGAGVEAVIEARGLIARLRIVAKRRDISEHVRGLLESAAGTLASLTPAPTPVSEAGGEPVTYSSTQATKCAGCGEYKHTPLRRDEMGGYVCLTCIGKRLDALAKPPEPAGGDAVREAAQRLVERFPADMPSHAPAADEVAALRAALAAALAKPPEPAGEVLAWMRRWAFDKVDVMTVKKADRPRGWSLFAVTTEKLLDDDVPLAALSAPASNPERASATPEPALTGGVQVKALDYVKPYGSETLTKAETLLGEACVWTHHEANGVWFWTLGRLASGQEASEADAKQMLWATYEARILSALSHPRPEQVEDEAVAYQQLINGKWVECSYFVAFGFGDKMAEGCRALYARPAPKPAADVVARAGVYRNSDGRRVLHLNEVDGKLGRLPFGDHDLVLATPKPAADVPAGWRDVMAERRRQVEAEGWTPEHDDCHSGGDIARAAACYAISSTEYPKMRGHKPPFAFPWDAIYWRPEDRRRDLVRAGALILAEIERLDRAAALTPVNAATEKEGGQFECASASVRPEPSRVETAARALCVYAIRSRRKWDTPPDQVEAMLAKGDVIDLAWRDFVGEAEAVLSALEDSKAGLADAHYKDTSTTENEEQR